LAQNFGLKSPSRSAIKERSRIATAPLLQIRTHDGPFAPRREFSHGHFHPREATQLTTITTLAANPVVVSAGAKSQGWGKSLFNKETKRSIQIVKMKTLALCLLSFLGMQVVLSQLALAADDAGRRSLWIDVYRGEPLQYEDVLDDLADAGVVYLGERHTIQQHHDLQAQIVTDLAKRGKPLVLGFEQLEAVQQPTIDRYNRGEITFDELAQAVKWPMLWPNYKQYESIVEAARKAKIPVLGLNAQAATIRQVARGGGVDRLAPKIRGELPKEINLNDPLYRKLLAMQMMVHVAANEETLRPMIEAQISRDETMADTLCNYLKSEAGRGRSAIVVCGAGHVSYGLGTPDRVRRRLPKITERIVLFSESGDTVLSPQELKAARAVGISHEQLRQISRPIADYLHETSLKEKKEEK
jgi:uncharacterized iron-regulated protein